MPPRNGKLKHARVPGTDVTRCGLRGECIVEAFGNVECAECRSKWVSAMRKMRGHMTANLAARAKWHAENYTPFTEWEDR